MPEPEPVPDRRTFKPIDDMKYDVPGVPEVGLGNSLLSLQCLLEIVQCQ